MEDWQQFAPHVFEVWDHQSNKIVLSFRADTIQWRDGCTFLPVLSNLWPHPEIVAYQLAPGQMVKRVS